ncbi:type III restriction endonuclease subunit R [bacterium]|nr:type III restriction endonuclease subunit R [bacterium]
MPFGQRTGVQAVDRLTIVAHDKFQEIVDEANREDSVIRRIDTIELDKDGAPNAPQPIAVKPVIEQILGVEAPDAGPAMEQAGPEADALQAPKPVFESATDRAIASATLKAITEKTRLPSATKLLDPTVQKEIVEKVRLTVPAAQQEGLPGFSESIEEVVSKATETYVSRSIDVPTITVVPTGEVTIIYDEFDLDTGNIHLQPVKEEILVQHLKTHEREHLTTTGGGVREARLEDHVVSALIGFDDVDYDSTADLLYKLAGELVAHLRSYISDEEDVRNVLVYYQRHIGRLVHAQMGAHRREHATGYEAKVLSGHRALEPQTFPLLPTEQVRSFRAPVDDKRRIAQMLFGGFQKCLYPYQKFHSDSERRFAVVLESDRDVQKWVKPGRQAFQIQLKGGSLYEPDFVAEASDGLYLCEVKQANMLEDEEVLSKADAAIVWCRHATEYTQTTSGKPWRYLLIPDKDIAEEMSFRSCAGRFLRSKERTSP